MLRLQDEGPRGSWPKGQRSVNTMHGGVIRHSGLPPPYAICFYGSTMPVNTLLQYTISVHTAVERNDAGHSVAVGTAAVYTM